MEIIINNRVFIKSLEKMKRIVSAKPAKGILSCFLLEAKDTEAIIFATDGNIGLQEVIPASVMDEGAVCLPLLDVLNAMKSLPKEENVCLSQRGSSSTVSFICRDAIFRISSSFEDDYPDFPECDLGKEKYISVNMLRDLFKYVDVTVPVEEQPSYYAPSGALLEWKQDSLEIAGTDGHRMTYIKKECFSTGEDISEVLPKKLLQIFPKVIGKVKSDAEADLHVIFSDTHVIFFEYGSLKIFSKLLENKFPNFKHRLLQSLPIKVELHREVFKSVITRAVATSKRHDIPTRFTFLPGGKLVLDVETEDLGNFHDELTIDYQKEEFSIGVNSCFILDFLRSINSSNSSYVSMQLNDDGKSPIIFSPRGEEDFRYAVMPIDLSEETED